MFIVWTEGSTTAREKGEGYAPTKRVRRVEMKFEQGTMTV